MASVSSCKDPKELYLLKQRAMKYYQENGVPMKMEQILNSMFHDDPPDVYGHLVNFFSQFTKPSTLKKVTAQQAIDCLGQPAVQTNMFCTVNNKEKLLCSLAIPNANIKVKPEEKEKAELDLQESVKSAIKIINEELADTFAGIDPVNQSEIDALLTSIVEKKKEEDLAKKASDEENMEDNSPQPPPPVDDKDKKKSAKGAVKRESKASAKDIQIEKGGKSSVAIDVVPDKPLEFFTAGSEIVSAISQSVCACAAQATHVPLYRHIANIARTKGAVNEFRIPLPMVTIVQSGKQGVGKVKCIKEYMIVPGPDLPIEKSVSHIQNIYNHVAKSLTPKMGVTAKYVNEIGALCPPVDVPNQVLDTLQEAVNGEGLTIGEDVFLAINAAAHECFDYEKGKYETVSGAFKSGDEMVEFWADIMTKYPSVCAIIDPLRPQDSEAWMKLCERVSEGVFIVGDNFYDRPGLLRREDLPDPVQTSGVVFNLERMTSVSDIIHCANNLQGAKNEIIIAANQGDTSDTFIVDLAVGLNARFFKVGGPCRGERSAKLNRLTQIASELEPAIAMAEEEEATQNETITQLEVVEDEKAEKEEGEEEEDEEEKVVEEEKTWGHSENNRLKLHDPFFFSLIQKKPDPPEEGEADADKDDKASSSPSSKRGK